LRVSSLIESAIKESGHKQADLTSLGFVGTPQAASRKLKSNTWTVNELLSVADWLGCKIIFQRSNGEQVQITKD